MQVSAPDYSNKSDEELLALASDLDSLTAEAREALGIELQRRGLDSPVKIAQFAEEQTRLSLADDVTRLGLNFRGNGRGVYGKFNREISGINEEYDSTVFLVVSYFPVIPTGRYRVSHEQGSKDLKFLLKQPLDWVQVAWIWMKAVAVVSALGVVMVLIATTLRH